MVKETLFSRKVWSEIRIISFREVGGANQKTLGVGWGMSIFWNHTIYIKPGDGNA